VVKRQVLHILSVCVRARSGVWVPKRVDLCMRVRICSLAYTACNAYASYCDVICVPSGFTTFFDINGTIFGKTLLNVKCVLSFSLKLLSKKSCHSKKNVTSIVINVKTSSCKREVNVKSLLFFSDFNKTLIFSTNFRKKV
jgi:hypothetical protein